MYTRGVVQVAAAGNTGIGSVLYPAHYLPVIAVAATDNLNSPATFSNYWSRGGSGSTWRFHLFALSGWWLWLSQRHIHGGALRLRIGCHFDRHSGQLRRWFCGKADGDYCTGFGRGRLGCLFRRRVNSNGQSPPTCHSTQPNANDDTNRDNHVNRHRHFYGNDDPIRHIRTRTHSPSGSWPHIIFASPTFTLTSTPSTTPSATIQSDRMNPAGNPPTATPTIAPSPGQEPGKSGLSTSWTICLGIALILIGLFLGWIARRITRSYKRGRSG